jgi:MFS transporter, DHA2 family, multidrug resistance protein
VFVSGPRPGCREWIGLAVLALPTLLLPEYRDTPGRPAGSDQRGPVPGRHPAGHLRPQGAGQGRHRDAAHAGHSGRAFRQRRLTSPLLDLRLFGTRTFSVALGIMLLGTVTMGGIFLFVTLYLRMVEGLSPLQAGLWLVSSALAVVADTMLAPAIARRIHPEYRGLTLLHELV